jgi:organic hydroperoxide reductase OsmC/OhrA
MADKSHSYAVSTTWTGNLGSGTSGYRDYSRDHEIRVDSKPDQVLLGSADAAFRGDPTRFNPEELLVIALSQCHLLSYLHACVLAKVVVLDYTDEATGTMVTNADGSGRFTEVTLNPRVTISADSDLAAAEQAHHKAHEMCFIANSVNFPVRHKPVITVAT